MPMRVPPRNKLLLELSPPAFGRLHPFLKLVELKRKRILQHPRFPIDQVYFVESGLVSVVAMTSEDNLGVESWVIGSEGLVGMPVVLGVPSLPYRRSVQVPGSAWAMSASDLTDAMDEVTELRRVLLRYVHSVLVQTAQIGACNARHHLTVRLARWLLMVQDRLETNSLPLTHDVTAKMLGVRRASITVALDELEAAGLIVKGRGSIRIRDRCGLEHKACHCYSVLRGGRQPGAWQGALPSEPANTERVRSPRA